jgi:hypothetical protein
MLLTQFPQAPIKKTVFLIELFAVSAASMIAKEFEVGKASRLALGFANQDLIQLSSQVYLPPSLLSVSVASKVVYFYGQ